MGRARRLARGAGARRTLPWGASIPLLAALDERGIPNAPTGCALTDAAVHALNERFPLADVALGTDSIRTLLVALGGPRS